MKNYCYKYPRPAVTTDAILVAKQQDQIAILLIQRGIDPYKGHWALPGGFIEMDEELEDACARELEEETGITGVQLQQLAAFGGVNRDPRGRTISVVFWAKVSSKLKAKAGDDAQHAKWFSLNNLPPLAFDHQKVIQQFIDEKINGI